MHVINGQPVDLRFGVRQKLECPQSERLRALGQSGVQDQLTNLLPASTVGMRVAVTMILLTAVTVIMVMRMIMTMILVVMVRRIGQLAIDPYIDLRRTNAAAIDRVNVEFGAYFERVGRWL